MFRLAQGGEPVQYNMNKNRVNPVTPPTWPGWKAWGNHGGFEFLFVCTHVPMCVMLNVYTNIHFLYNVLFCLQILISVYGFSFGILTLFV